VDEKESSISALLVAPESLQTSRPETLTVYMPESPPQVHLNGALQHPESLGRGFYRVAQVRPGVHSLRVE
jgi:hypothetical protein